MSPAFLLRNFSMKYRSIGVPRSKPNDLLIGIVRAKSPNLTAPKGGAQSRSGICRPITEGAFLAIRRNHLRPNLAKSPNEGAIILVDPQLNAARQSSKSQAPASS